MKESGFMHFIDLLITPPDLENSRDFQSRTRISLALQILMIACFSCFDLLILIGFIGGVIPGITVGFLIAYFIGRFKYPKVSTILSMSLISILTFSFVWNMVPTTGQSMFGILIWIAWPILLSSLLLKNRITIMFTIANLVMLFLVPLINPLIAMSMVIGPASFIIGISAIAIMSSWMVGKSQTQILALSQAIDNSPVAVMMTDLHGSISYVNPAFTKITGYSSDDIAGKDCRILKSGLTHRETYDDLWTTLMANQNWHGLFINKTKRGIIFHEEMWISPLLDENKKPMSYVGMGVDITARKQLERHEAEQKQELEIYSSLIRHDLLNDLGVILGNIDLGRTISDEENTELFEIMESTESVVIRMSNLLRAFSQSGTKIETNPAKLIRNAAALATGVDTQLSIHVEVTHDAEDLEISGSRLLPMVFDNLFRNATIHAGERPAVNVAISNVGESVKIIISDNGPGIAEEVRGRLFQRGASTRGGGLGLYLSRQIVLSRNGTIEVADYEEGKGATFIIRLPIIERTI